MRHSTIFSLFPLLSLCATAVTVAAAAEPVTVALPTPLYRALTAGADPEHAAGLRGQLRAALLGDGTRPAWDADCEQDRQDSDAAPGLWRQRLSDGSWLLRVECSAGAYQGSFWAVQLWRQAGPAEPGRAALLTWRVPRQNADGSRGSAFTLSNEVVLWGELSLPAAPAGGVQVEVVNRFRGIGDCGTRSRYRLHRGHVGIATLAAVFSCPDTPATVPLGPADWPVLSIFDR